MAEVNEAAGAQGGLQLLGALQELRLRHHLTDVDHVRAGLLRLLRLLGLLGGRLRVFQGDQLPTKLRTKELKKGGQLN